MVSVPCLDNFRALPASEREGIVPATCRARVAVEAGVSLGWHELTGDGGLVIGIDRFGASAPDDVLAEKYGLTVDAVCEKIRNKYFS